MNKAVFLDRDGVINEVCYDDDRGIYSATTVEEFNVLPCVKEAIAILKEHGFVIIVVTNQPGVAFGYIKKEDVYRIDVKLKEECLVDGVYHCFHHPKYTGECDCRKPKPGLLVQAAKQFNIDLKNSYMIGDNLSDIKAGEACRKTFLIGNSLRCDACKMFEKKNIKPDYIVEDLYSAVTIITKLEQKTDE